jgi:hypothetical protein
MKTMIPHVTQGNPSEARSTQPTFDSGLIQAGGTFEHTFAEVGQLTIIVHHPWMIGKAIVD